MSERVTLGAMILAALCAVVLLFGPRDPNARAPTERPLSTEWKPGGLAVAATWLRDCGLKVRPLRQRYSALDASARGDLLIVHSPLRVALRDAERAALATWIARGNTLIVLAALADAPAWAAPGQSVSSAQEDVERIAGLELARSPRTPVGPPAPAPAGHEEPVETVLSPLWPHPYFAGVHSVVGFSDRAAGAWTAQRSDDDQEVRLRLARTVSSGQTGDGLWVVPRAAGRVVVVAMGSPLTNRAIGAADNAAFLGALVTASLARDGTVWFDDAHQGGNDYYDAHALATDGRLYATLGIVVSLWLVWVLGLQRLVAPPPAALPDESELVASGAGLLQRQLSDLQAARLMLDRFARRRAIAAAGAASLADATPQDARPGAIAAAHALREAQGALDRGARVNLVALRRAIVTLEGLLR